MVITARAQGLSFYAQLKKIEEGLDEIGPEFMRRLGNTVISLSPVDTGDYVMSHTISTTSVAGQVVGVGQRSGRAGGQSESAMQALARAQLYDEIDGLSKTSPRYYLANTVYHANFVEYGGPNWRRSGYFVYDQARNIAPSILRQVVAEVMPP